MLSFLKNKDVTRPSLTRVRCTVHNERNTVSSRLGHQMEKQRGGEMMKTIILLGVILTF
ncbi:hypothetical protein QNN00_24730 [Bacillus velezensis]|nr:hypothetical protein [Bacillus velezensis]